jgi:hypothetical protein
MSFLKRKIWIAEVRITELTSDWYVVLADSFSDVQRKIAQATKHEIVSIREAHYKEVLQ